MAQLQYINGMLKEMREPKPGQSQYYMIVQTVTGKMSFYVWSDAPFLASQTLQIGANYNIGYEERPSGGKIYRTAREMTVADPGAAPPATPAQMAAPMQHVAQAVPPMPVPQVQTQPVQQAPVQAAPPPAAVQQGAPNIPQRMVGDFHVSAVYGLANSLLAGEHCTSVLEALTQAEADLRAFLNGQRHDQAPVQQNYGGGPVGDEPPPYEDYPQ